MPWEIERIKCNGNTCDRAVEIVESEEIALNTIFHELPWYRVGEQHFVGDAEPLAYEEVEEMINNHFLEVVYEGANITYRLRELS